MGCFRGRQGGAGAADGCSSSLSIIKEENWLEQNGEGIFLSFELNEGAAASSLGWKTSKRKNT